MSHYRAFAEAGYQIFGDVIDGDQFPCTHEHMAWRRATNFRQTSPFPFYERCLFRGVFLVNKRRGLSNFLSPFLSPDAVSSRSERWYTSLRHVI